MHANNIVHANSIPLGVRAHLVFISRSRSSSYSDKLPINAIWCEVLQTVAVANHLFMILKPQNWYQHLGYLC